MKKQSLKALAPMAIFAVAMTAVAEESAVVEVERTAEVSEVLNAGAKRFRRPKKLKLMLIELLIKPMVCCRNSNRSISKLNH